MPRRKPQTERLERGLYKVTRTRSDGSQRVTFQIRYGDGSGMTSKTYATKTEAKNALTKAKARVLNGDDTNAARGETRFKAAAEDWLSSHPDWKLRTAETNRSTVDKKLAELHGLRLRQLTPKVLLDFRTGLLRKPKSNGDLLSPASIRRTMSVLHAICEHAELSGLLASNPCKRLPPLKTDHYQPTRGISIPTPSEVDSLIAFLGRPTPAHLDSKGRSISERPADPRWALLVEAAAFTGLRAGELAGLKKADLNFDAQTLTVRRTIINVAGEPREGTPKSKAGRRVLTVDPDLARRLKKHTFGLKPGDYVFGFSGPEDEWRPLRHNMFAGRAFKRACTELGLEITFHDLRHFHASYLIAIGFTPLEVAQRLGHSSAAFTLRQYGHLWQQQSDTAGDRISAARAADRGEQRHTKTKRPF